MKALIEFTLKTEPPKVTHQSKKLGWRTGKGGKKRPSLRDSEKLKGAIDTYAVDLMTQPNRPPVPLTGNLFLHVFFIWRADEAGWYPQKPDGDNAYKTLCDAMAAAGYFVDDKMIVHFSVSKGQGKTPGTIVRLGYVGPWDTFEW